MADGVRLGASRRGGRRGVLVAVLFAVVYLWGFPYFASMRSANELPRIFLSEEIVTDHRLDLDCRLSEMGSRFDLASTPDGHYYSNKAPGVSLLGVPVVAANVLFDAGEAADEQRTTWLLRVIVVTLPCLGFLMLLWRFTGWFAAPAPSHDDARAGAGIADARRRALVAYGLGSMALPYGVLFFSHALAAAAAGAAFALAVGLVHRGSRRPVAVAFAIGGLAGASVLIDYQALLAALAVGGYLLLRTPPDAASPSRRRLRDVAAATVGAAIPLVGLAAYHTAAFGAPWRTGYAFAADPAHKQGVLGIIGPNRGAMWNAFLSPSNGLLVLSPWVVVAALGVVVVARDRELRRRLGPEVATAAAIAAAYLLFIGSLVPEFGRAGWSVGPRYIGVAMPFLAWLAVLGFAVLGRRAATSVIAAAMVVAAVIVHVAATATFPHWPDRFANPLYEVSFRALADGLAPHSLATALGVMGPTGLVPLFGAALAIAVWAVRPTGGSPRRRHGMTLAMLVLGSAIIAGYAGFPRTDLRSRERMWSFVRSVWQPSEEATHLQSSRETVIEPATDSWCRRR